MKTKSVWKQLGRFRNYSTDKNTFIFTSRREQTVTRFVQLKDQGGNAIALPVIVEADGNERVVFSAKTIKSLVEFLEGK